MLPHDSDIPGDTPLEKAKWLVNAAREEAAENPQEGIDLHLRAIERMLNEVTEWPPLQSAGPTLLSEPMTTYPLPEFRITHTDPDGFTTEAEVYDKDAWAQANGMFTNVLDVDHG